MAAPGTSAAWTADLEAGRGAAAGGKAEGPGAGKLVHLRLDYITDAQTRAILACQRVATLISCGLLAWEVEVKFEKSGNFLLRTNVQEIVNVTFGSLCLAALLATSAWFLHRVLSTQRSGKHWTRDRRNIVLASGIALYLELGVVAAWLAANLYSLVVLCGWFDDAVDYLAFVSWVLMSSMFWVHLAQGLNMLPREDGGGAALQGGAQQAEPSASQLSASFESGQGLGGGSSSALGPQAQPSFRRRSPPLSDASEASHGGEAAGRQREAARAALAQRWHGAKHLGHEAASGGSMDSWQGLVAGGKLGSGNSEHSGWGADEQGEREKEGRQEGTGVEGAGGVPAGGAGAVGAAKWSQGMKLTVLAAALLWLPSKVLLVLILLTTLGRIGNLATEDCAEQTPECLAQLTGNDPSLSCRDWNYDCAPPTELVVMTSLLACLFLVKVVLGLGLMLWVQRRLRRLPYYQHRIQNIAIELQIRTRALDYILYGVFTFLLWYIGHGSCTSSLQMWGLGPGPFHVFMSAMVVTEAIMYMPSDPDEGALRLHTVLQRFAWTEAEVPARLRQRAAATRGSVGEGEPLFCVETALKATYLSLHMYRHFRPESTISCLDTALGLYGLSHHEWIHEPAHDTNCLLAWGSGTMVIAFRGTQSMQNVLSDIKIWRKPHPPKRGSVLLGRCPMVHTGFLQSWTAGGLNSRVLQRVREVIEGARHRHLPQLAGTLIRCCSPHEGEQHDGAAEPAAAGHSRGAGAGGEAGSSFDDEENPSSGGLCGLSQGSSESSCSLSDGGRSGGGIRRVLVTGHSLGGALATLCSLDLAKALPGWQSAQATAPRAAPARAGAKPLGQRHQHHHQHHQHHQQQQEEEGQPWQPSVACYTVGCPRVGNGAFAREYNQRVPDSWSVINDQDAVAKEGKFLFLFSRTGKVAIINSQGDLLVLPSFIERSAQRGLKISLSQHLLMAYFAAWAAILRAQARGPSSSLGVSRDGSGGGQQQAQWRKGLPGGEAGVRQLLECAYVREMLVKVLGFRQASLAGMGGPQRRRGTGLAARLDARGTQRMARRKLEVDGESKQGACAAGLERDPAAKALLQQAGAGNGTNAGGLGRVLSRGVQLLTAQPLQRLFSSGRAAAGPVADLDVGALGEEEQLAVEEGLEGEGQERSVPTLHEAVTGSVGTALGM